MSELWRLEGGGTLSLREDGLRVRLEAVRPDDGRGLYKVWIWGGGGRFLLGTLVPERGALRLNRTVSRQSLLQAGCWPVEGGGAELAGPFFSPKAAEKEPCADSAGNWVPVRWPERLCRDYLIRESLQGQTGFYVQNGNGRALLSAPFCPNQPFPIPILFCFAEVEFRAGRPWLVWAFGSDGNPLIPTH